MKLTAPFHESWLFKPPHQRSSTEQERWWQECYLSKDDFEDFLSEPDWHILVGSVGAGRSTALAALARYARDRSFVVDYTQECWPGGSREFIPGGNHLSQIMALVAYALRDEIRKNAGKLDSLSKTQSEFLRWLFVKHLGTRALELLLDSADGSRKTNLAQVPYRDLYETHTSARDVEGQIDELATLVQALGYQQVMILIDISLTINREQCSGLVTLYSWLKLMEHPGFTIAAAFPQALFQRYSIGNRTRARAHIYEMEWSQSEIDRVVQNHLRTCSDGQITTLEQLASSDLLEKLHNWLVKEYRIPTPQGWLQLTRLILKSAFEHDLPLQENCLEEIMTRYYQEYMPLYFDANTTQLGIWRGPSYVSLDEQPLNFLRAVATASNQLMSETQLQNRLFEVAGSRGNIHTLAKRVRLAIEPNPEKPIYLKNTRRDGYFLDHFMSFEDQS